MRTRKVIEDEYKATEFHIREVLLDIRDLLVKFDKQSHKKKQEGKK